MTQTPSESINNTESQGAAGLDSFGTNIRNFRVQPDDFGSSLREKPAEKSTSTVTASGLSDIHDPAQRDNLSRFLGAIGASEGADYNTVVGGNTFSDMSRHPGIIGLVTKDGPSTAAGRYQITGTTYRDIAPKIGISDFSAESQDKIAVALLQRRGALDDVLSGNFNGAVAKLGDEWQSLPSGTSKNQGKRTQAFFDKALTLATGSTAAQAAEPEKAQPAPLSKAPKWSTVIGKPEYQSLSAADKTRARDDYFRRFIEPNIDPARRDEYRDRSNKEADRVEAEARPSAWESIKSGVSGAIDAVGKLMESTPDSVMAGAPAGKGATSPVSPEFNAQFNAAWDAATPDQRTLMAQRPDMMGDLAKSRNAQYADSDANTTDIGKTADMLDPRAEARSRQLARNGMAPELTADYARNAAARGVMPGDEVGSVSNSTFDFDAQKKFSEDPFFSNPVVRGAVKGYEGFKVGALGVNQFLGETVGADEFARTQADAAKASKNYTGGIGESNNYGQRMFEGAISSVAQQVPALIGGVVTGSEALVLGSMFAQSFGQEYSAGRSQGQTQGDATLRAGLFGTFEVIGEKFGMKQMLKGLQGSVSGMATKDVSTYLAKALLLQIPGEELTTLGQFMTDKLPAGVGLNTEAGLSQYLSQAADTLVQTVMQGGIMTGAGAGVAHGINRLESPESKIAREINSVQLGSGGTDAAARAALDPNQSGTVQQDTARPVVPDIGQAPNAPGQEQPAAPVQTEIPPAAPELDAQEESDAIDAAHLLDDAVEGDLPPMAQPAEPAIVPAAEIPIPVDLAVQHAQTIADYKDAAASGNEQAAQAAQDNLTAARQELSAAHVAAAQDVTDQLIAVQEKVAAKPKTEKEAKARRAAQAVAVAPPISEEAYLSQNGASRQSIGDAGLHRSSSAISKRTWSKSVDVQAEKDSALVARRAALRKEYTQKIASGELRAPTSLERLQDAATGMPELEATQAANRLLKKRRAAQVPEAVLAIDMPTTLDVAAHEAATSPLNDVAQPTDGQKEAGNYKVGKINLHGMDISIENPVGSKRSGTDKDGVTWETEMQHHYGYIKGTVGMDKDHIDTFIGTSHDSNKVFVVDQVDPATGKQDEAKVMLGFDSKEQAHAAYQANYAKGWAGGKVITETSMEGFKDWLKSGNTKKPFARPKTEKEARARRAAQGPVKTRGDQMRDNLKASDPFLSLLATEGVSPLDKADIGMDRGNLGNRMIPGHGPVFRKDGLRLDLLALRAFEDGHLSQSDMDTDGGVGKLADMIRRTVAGKEVIRSDAQHIEANAAQHNDDALMQEAASLGINTAGKTVDQVYDEVVMHHAGQLEEVADDIQFDMDATRATVNHLTDEEVDALFGIGKAAEDGASTQESAGTVSRIGDQGSATPAESFSLKSETASESTARVNKQEQQQASTQAANVAADNKAQADAEVGNFTLTGSDRKADVGASQGQGNLLEQKRDDYTQDMFGADLPNTQRGVDRAQGRPTTKDGSVDTTDAVPAGSRFASRTQLVTENTRQLGASSVRNMEDAAQAMSYLGRGAVERFDGLVTDKDGKPLAVVGAFKGALAQASVYPSTVIGEAFRIKGAANIWFAHNHPGGSADLSQADRELYKNLKEAFRGSAIEPRGLFAIAGGVQSDRMWQMTDDDTTHDGITAAPEGNTSVPSVERHYTQDGKFGYAISSPQAAKKIAVELSHGESGILLLNVRNQPLAFVPVTTGMPLRNNGNMDALYRAISMANSGSSMIVNHGALSGPDIRNLGGLLNSVDSKLLDVFDVEEGSVRSWAEHGDTLATENFYSVADKALPESRWLSAGVLEDIVEKHMAQFATPIPVRIVDRTTDVVGDSVEVQGGVVAGGVTKGGVVHLIREGLPTAGEAIKTLFHELLHFGLRRFLTKSQYVSTMRQLYNSDGWVRAYADQWIAGSEGDGLRAEGYATDYIRARGVDEALAKLSETINTTETGYNNTGFKAKTIRTISRWLARLADTLGFTEAAARYRAVNNDEARALIKSIFSKLRDGAAPGTTSTEWQYSDPAFSRPANPAQGNLPGTLPPPAARPIPTRQQNPLPLPGGASGNNASWDAPENTRLDSLIYVLQDKHIDLRRVVQTISKVNQPADSFDPYLQEELYHGRTSSRTDAFVNKELTPLLKNAVARQLTLDEIDHYLHARHAKEANALIADRNPAIPDGGSGMTDADADAYFAGLTRAKRDHLAAVAVKIDAIMAETRRLYASYGLESADTVKGWGDMFAHYVPLMREDHDGGMGVGQGFSIKGKEVRHRTGSTRAVVDILSNIALQREKVIVRGEKNRVAVALAGLAKLNQNPDFWTFNKVPTTQEFNPKTGLVETRVDTMFKNRENVVVAKIKDSKGEIQERAIVFNEHNERALRMALSMKNLDAAQLTGVLGVSADITRYFAAINTQYNPVFGVTNLTRDVGESLINLQGTELRGQRRALVKNIGPALKHIGMATRADRRGEEMDSDWARIWEEFKLEGGITGFRDMYANSADRTDTIKSAMHPTAWMDSTAGKIFTANGTLKVPMAKLQGGGKVMLDVLSDYNTAMENATRLSAYKLAREHGMSKQRSASLAKNLTVNFNRKGAWGSVMGAMFMFYNAAVQGTARIAQIMLTMDNGDIKTLRLTAAGKKILIGGIAWGAIQAVLLAAAGFGDDEPPEFVRERNIIIPIGGKKYVTIPMPLGYHVLTNIGRIPAEFALGGYKKPTKHALKLIGIVIEAFNPIGSAGLSGQSVTPTPLDPLIALSEDKDWTGKPIAKPTFDKLAPGYTRIKSTASAPAKIIAEAINYIFGGTEFVAGDFSPTPDQIDYLFGQITGGVGRELSKTAQSVTAVATGADLPPHKIPLVGRFYGDAENAFSHSNKFYANTVKLKSFEKEIKGRQEDHRPIKDYIDKNPGVRMIEIGKGVEKQVKAMRKYRKQMEANNASREDIKAMNDKITDTMREFNNRMKEAESSAVAN